MRFGHSSESLCTITSGTGSSSIAPVAVVADAAAEVPAAAAVGEGDVAPCDRFESQRGSCPRRLRCGERPREMILQRGREKNTHIMLTY